MGLVVYLEKKLMHNLGQTYITIFQVLQDIATQKEIVSNLV